MQMNLLFEITVLDISFMRRLIFLRTSRTQCKAFQALSVVLRKINEEFIDAINRA